MLKRKVQLQIEEWIANGKDSLLVTGARQTGKTFIIRELLKRSGDYVELNFLERPELVDLFETAKSTKDLLMRISVVAEKELKPGQTFIFLDEIQRYSDIITRIKFLVEEGSYRYILSGSLLGVELKDIRSVPVGYMKEIISQIKHCFDERNAVDEYLHKKLIDAFYLYLIVGGMPEAVQTYIDTNDIAKVASVQEKIIRAYKWDFAQYQEDKKLKLTEIYDTIPGELEEKNKRFFVNHVAGKIEFDRVKNDFLWLKNAGVVIPVYNVQELRKPLIMSEKRNLFKLFMSDIGLLTSRYSSQVKYQILQKDKNIKNGGLFENVVAQELAAHGVKTWYYNSKKHGELDFVIESEGHVIPIEVKSGKDYKKHNALNNVLANDAYNAEKALVLYDGNLVCKENITYMPVYMASCIRDNKPESMIYSLRWTE